jgi:hypothetical protein
MVRDPHRDGAGAAAEAVTAPTTTVKPVASEAALERST